MELKMIPLKKCHPNPLQPRQEFNREKLMELANSIREGDLLQPIVVKKDKEGYEIVAGERRWKAFNILKEPNIPAVVRKFKDENDVLEKSLIENWHRVNLNTVEGENALNTLWESGNYKSHIELGKKLGIPQQTISDVIRGKKERESLTDISYNEKLTYDDFTRSRSLEKFPETRKKLLEMRANREIPSQSELHKLSKKLAEFETEEQQLEILDIWEQKTEEDNETFNGVVEKYKEIADGERPIELIVDDDPSKIRFNTLKGQCEPLLWLTPVKLDKIEHKEFYKRSIELLKKTENHIHKLLIKIGEYEVAE